MDWYATKLALNASKLALNLNKFGLVCHQRKLALNDTICTKEKETVSKAVGNVSEYRQES